jgi:hypothetical protein
MNMNDTGMGHAQPAMQERSSQQVDRTDRSLESRENVNADKTRGEKAANNLEKISLPKEATKAGEQSGTLTKEQASLAKPAGGNEKGNQPGKESDSRSEQRKSDVGNENRNAEIREKVNVGTDKTRGEKAANNLEKMALPKEATKAGEQSGSLTKEQASLEKSPEAGNQPVQSKAEGVQENVCKVDTKDSPGHTPSDFTKEASASAVLSEVGNQPVQSKAEEVQENVSKVDTKDSFGQTPSDSKSIVYGEDTYAIESVKNGITSIVYTDDLDSQSSQSDTDNRETVAPRSDDSSLSNIDDLQSRNAESDKLMCIPRNASELIPNPENHASNIVSEKIGDNRYEFSADHVKSIAAEAARNNFKNCSGSVREAAQKLGIELRGSQANDQVKFMEKNWNSVGMEEAKQLAERGNFVVAGLEKSGHGHIAVVVDGDGVIKEGRVWPNIAGGSLGNKEAIEKPGHPYSEGGNTIRDAWGKASRNMVKFYTPK